MRNKLHLSDNSQQGFSCRLFNLSLVIVFKNIVMCIIFVDFDSMVIIPLMILCIINVNLYCTDLIPLTVFIINVDLDCTDVIPFGNMNYKVIYRLYSFIEFFLFSGPPCPCSCHCCPLMVVIFLPGGKLVLSLKAMYNFLVITFLTAHCFCYMWRYVFVFFPPALPVIILLHALFLNLIHAGMEPVLCLYCSALLQIWTESEFYLVHICFIHNVMAFSLELQG